MGKIRRKIIKNNKEIFRNKEKYLRGNGAASSKDKGWAKQRKVN